MTEHALRVLEFQPTLERVAQRASSEMGREAVRSLRPMESRADAARELDRVYETRQLRHHRPDWSPPGVPDVRRALRVLEVEGGVLEPRDLLLLGHLLESSRLLAAALARRVDEEERPALSVLRELLHRDPQEEERVARVVDPEGEVKDGASAELRGIRLGLRRARSRIVSKLEQFLTSLPERWRVPDASVSVREGRYVIPLRREAKGEVGGVIHGESGSGATLFVEPPLAISLMNELRDLEREEEREVRRILQEASRRLRPRREVLDGTFQALVDFDTLWARACTADEWEAALPTLVSAAEGLTLVDARHPLLLEQLGSEVVPYHLEMGEGERVLVVSGPNTGGKTVFLKAVGLFLVLGASGVVPPVGEGSRLPFVRRFFADIGDEQSIQESLSTFSAHLQNQHRIVEGADADSLVLMDEMGTGTDPAEGAALARAVLEELSQRGPLTLVTSHLGALKRLAGEVPGVVNASLQFDPDRIAPTYVLQKGRPGRSYGLAIARRLGFPAAVLDRAEGHLGEAEVSMEELLESLERKEREARELLEATERRDRKVEELEAELDRREEELRERERTAEKRAREEARRLLMEARQEVEEAIHEVRSGGEEALEETARRARRRVEDAADHQRERAPEVERVRKGAPTLEVGDRVRVQGGGVRGVVTEVRDDRVVVDASGMRLQLPATELEVVSRNEGKTARAAAEGGSGSPSHGGDSGAGGWTAPAPDASTEVDLRGLRLDEVDGPLQKALDDAVLADLPQLLVIHGKGTGALRSRVREVLEGDPRVEEFRAGEPGEGGSGVTVVHFR